MRFVATRSTLAGAAVDKDFEGIRADGFFFTAVGAALRATFLAGFFFGVALDFARTGVFAFFGADLDFARTGVFAFFALR